MNSHNWIERGLTSIAATYGRYPLVAASGKGCWLTDIDGKKYLDFLAGVAVNNLGHCHPKVVAAIQQQAETLLHCSNFYHIPQQIELAELLCEYSFGDRVFFCNSGAEANEAAIKLARKYSSENYRPERIEVITALASFHGRTFGGISATGQEKVRNGFGPVVPGFSYIPFGDIKALRAAITPHSCAIMLEPLQGEGGVNIPPVGYLQAVRELCDERELLLIVDEVQVGCGRTGSLFAYQQEEIEPDVMTLAKALAGGPPIGAMLAREKYAVALGPGTHGSTFGGNPLIAAAGLAAMKALLEDGILENCTAMGDYLRRKLEALQEKYNFIVEVRGRGLMQAVEVDTAEQRNDVVMRCFDKGLVILGCGPKSVRFCPALVVDPVEIDCAVRIFAEALAETLR